MATLGRPALVLASGAASTMAAGSLAQRSLFIRVSPAPATLSERRSVLRVLERQGKTDMFKKLGDTSFVAITPTAAAATALIERSPIQYEFLAETFQTVQPWGHSRVTTDVQSIERALGASDDVAAEADVDDASTMSPLSPLAERIQQKSFIVNIFPSTDYHHYREIRHSSLHGPWPKDFSGVRAPTLPGGNINYKNTLVYNALRDVMPEGVACEALCDWRTPEERTPESGYQTGGDAEALAETIGRARQRQARQKTGRAIFHRQGRQEGAGEKEADVRRSGDVQRDIERYDWHKDPKDV